MSGAQTPLVYTPYSLRRLERRGITREEVQAVVDSKSKTVRPSRHAQGRKVHTATVAGRRISVVVGPGHSSVNTVVTAWCPDEDDTGGE